MECTVFEHSWDFNVLQLGVRLFISDKDEWTALRGKDSCLLLYFDFVKARFKGQD